jgi:SMI1-KNR4 cell-wall
MDVLAVAELEALCGASLPPDWLALMAGYPEGLRTALRSEDGTADQGTVSGMELFASPQRVISVNREVRTASVLDPDGQEFRWPEQLLVIGENGAGDYYCLDTDGEHTGVLQFHHLSVEFEVVADSVQEFVDLLTETYLDGESL